MYKPSSNPTVLALTLTTRTRRLNLSDLKPLLQDGKKVCIWCLSPLRGQQRKWCSSLCSNSAFAWANPQSNEGLAYLLARQAYNCAACNMNWNLLADSLKGTRGIPMFFDNLQMYSVRLIKALKRQSPKGTKPEVDHIIPIAKGGQAIGFENHEAKCSSCHLAKTKIDNSGRRRKLSKV